MPRCIHAKRTILDPILLYPMYMYAPLYIYIPKNGRTEEELQD